MELEPERVLWLIGLANAYRDLGIYDEAALAYRQVLVLEPGNLRATKALKALAP